jgi:prepilin-type N-terminal cleavage/methylation domain-containing protein
MIRMTSFAENSAYEKGFTLVEMAMVLAIVALLLTGLVPTISGQIEQQRMTETKRQLSEIQQALIGFAIINGRLPCPAPQGSGTESPSGGACNNSYNGVVPGVTLGLNSLNENGEVLDAWDNPIRYVVTSSDSNAYTTSNGIASTGLENLDPNLVVCTTATSITTTDCVDSASRLTALPGVPVVLFSTGKNGAQGGLGIDETANLDGTNANNNRTFVSHTPTGSSSANGEFDDMVVWISNQVLISRMVNAGRLP